MRFDIIQGDMGLVLDARGNLISAPISGDTETGEVLCAVVDIIGRRRFVDDTWETETEVRHYPEPLQIIPVPKGWIGPCQELRNAIREGIFGTEIQDHYNLYPKSWMCGPPDEWQQTPEEQ